MPNAILIHTVRGGKDPDNFYTVVTEELYNELDEDEVWATLGEYADDNDPRVIVFYEHDRVLAVGAAESQGYTISEEADAVGY